MKIDITTLKPNPFRDFDLYPLDDEQVQRLSQSINELGFFAGVSARKNGVGYELAAGHHRIEAARRSGLKEIEATVKSYDDQQMVQIMSMENLTQRGKNAAAVLDSVAAYTRLVTKQVLLGEGTVSKILETAGNGALEGTQAKVAQDGPGMPLLYRAINGFGREERGEKKDVEIITETAISQTLAALKASGVMGKIVAKVYAEIETIRAERDAKAKAAAVDALAKAETEVEVERRRKEREAIKAQEEMESTYDMRCGNVFRLTSHEAAFREAVLTPNGRRFIALEQHLALAQHVRAQIDAIEHGTRRDLGSVSIKQMVGDHITQAITAQQEIDAAEKQRLLSLSAVERVNGKWKQLAATVARVETFLSQIAEEEAKWEYDQPFPMNVAAIERMALAAKLIGKLKEKIRL
jgi:hypothetical protein